MSLRARLALAFALTSLVVIGAIAALVYGFTYAAAREQASTRLAYVATGMREHLDRWMYERRHDVGELAEGGAGRSLREGPAWLRARVERLQAEHPEFSWIGFTDAKGRVLAATNGMLEGDDVSGRPWWSTASRGEHVGEVHAVVPLRGLLDPGAREPAHFVNIAFPVRENGVVVGVVGAYVGWNAARGIADLVLRNRGAAGQVDLLIVGRDGRVLLGPKSLEGNSLPPALGGAARPDGYGDDAWPDGRQYVSAASLTRGERSYAGLGWQVIARQGREAAFASADRLRGVLLITGAAGVLVTSLLAYLLAGRFARPLEEWAAVADRIGAGDRELRFPEVPGTSELARLSAALRSMAVQLRSKEDLLNEKVRERTAALVEAMGALGNERERLAYALEGSRLATWELDLEKGVVTLSSEWARIVGGPPGETLATPVELLSRVPESEHAALEEAILKVLKGEEEHYDLEHRVVRQDATWLWIRSRGRVSKRSADGRALRMNGTNADITRRKEGERRVLEREGQMRLVTDNLPVMINLLDAQFRYLFVNRPYLAFFGLEEDQVLGRTIAEVAGREAQEIAESFMPRLRAGETVVHERVREDRRGRTRHFELHLVPYRDEAGGLMGHFSLIDDVTERREAGRRLALAVQHLRMLADGVDSLIAHFDLEAQLLFANRRYREWFGIAAESVPGLPASEFAGAEAMRVLLSHMPAIRRGESVTYETVRARGPETHEFEVRLEPQRGISGEVEGVYVTLNDITSRKTVERGLTLQAFTDPVTTLPNRRLLLDRLDVAVARARRNRSPFALLYLDLDGFKAVNDTLGHDAGDELLRRVGERLALCVRASDTVARVGGDEFALLLDPVGTPEDADAVAAKVLAALQAPFALSDGEARISASIGVAIHPRDGADVVSLQRAADAAMYRAKAAGKSRAMPAR